MRVLFICIGNSCRSQMAEGWARHLGLDCASAGTDPASSVAGNAVTVMAEVGVDISQQTPSLVDDFSPEDFDLIFSMGCGVSCSNIQLDGDWELADPVGQSLDIYRKTRDEIERRVNQLAVPRE